MPQLPSARTALWLCAAGIGGLHLLAALPFQAPLHADELFQYLEQPFRALHGFGFEVWEFERGTRSWLLPGAILGILRACEAAGLTDPLHQLAAVRIFEKLLFLCGLFSLVRACDLLAGRRAAWLCALGVGLQPALVLATCHPLSEPFSMAFAMLATWPAARFARDPRLRHLALAGALLGVATVLRLQTAVLIPAFAAYALARPGPRLRGLALPGGALAVLALGGLLDLWTYGDFAHSTVANLQAHFEDDGALQALMGTQPATFYATEAFKTLGPLALLLAAALLWTFWQRGADVLALPALTLLLVHAAMPHKELRFLLPALPLALAALAVALADLPPRRWLTGLALGVWLASAPFAWQALRVPPGPILATRWLGQQPELKDFCTVGIGRFETGGFFFLRRDVPFRPFATFAELGALPPGQCRFVLAPSMPPPNPQTFHRVAHFDGADVYQAR